MIVTRAFCGISVSLGILVLAGCASWGDDASRAATAGSGRNGPTSPQTQVPAFSRAVPGAGVPAGWEPYIIHPRKKHTRYEVSLDNGEPVLQATSKGSASGLWARLDVDPAVTPIVQWRWRTEAHLDQADNTDPAREDAPVRLILAFDGDKASLPVRDQMFFERARLFAGVDMPYATLMYIWGHGQPLEAIFPSPHTSRVQKIVVCNDGTGTREWHRLRRNIIDDYRRAYGRPPGRLVGVAILTDTDNTDGSITAYYGDIRLSSDSGP